MKILLIIYFISNTFIEDKNGKDAIDICLINRNKEMVEYKKIVL